MAARGWGRVINLGSILSVIGLPGRAPYAASKAGIVNLTRVLALEWADRGVTVNAICPGPFGTEMNKPLLEDPEKFKAFVAKIPMGRWGDLHEIAGVAVFLASDASSFVTGSSVFVDGGWTAQMIVKAFRMRVHPPHIAEYSGATIRSGPSSRRCSRRMAYALFIFLDEHGRSVRLRGSSEDGGRPSPAPRSAAVVAIDAGLMPSHATAARSRACGRCSSRDRIVNRHSPPFACAFSFSSSTVSVYAT